MHGDIEIRHLMIPLTCDHCEKKLRLRDELAGKRIKCPGCGGVLTVPLLESDDEAPPPKKEAAFTPVKPSRMRPVDDDDEEDDDSDLPPAKRSQNVRKPNAFFLVVGLILGLGGLIAMSACIVLAKQANDRIGDVQDTLKRRQVELEQAANDMHRNNVTEEIERLQAEIDEIQRSEVTRYTLFAVLCGVLFIVGFGIRGYYHVAMKRWHAATHGTSKKKKRRDDDEEDDE